MPQIDPRDPASWPIGEDHADAPMARVLYKGVTIHEQPGVIGGPYVWDDEETGAESDETFATVEDAKRDIDRVGYGETSRESLEDRADDLGESPDY